MAMWPRRVYTRKKRGGPRLNLTPTPDLGLSATAEAPSGLGRRLAVHCKPLWSGLGGGRSWKPGWLGLRPRDSLAEPRPPGLFALNRAALLQARKDMTKRTACGRSWRKRSRAGLEGTALGR